jgi:hypothetical protein
MRAILYKIAHFDGCLAQTKSGPLHEKDPVPNANSFFTPGLLVCAVKTMICYGFLAKHRIDFIPGIRASAQPPAIDPYAVTSYCQFEESQSANSLSSGAACVTKTVVRGCGAGAGLMRASNHGRKWDLKHGIKSPGTNKSELAMPALFHGFFEATCGGGARRAASMKRRRSAALRYFRLPELTEEALPP